MRSWLRPIAPVLPVLGFVIAFGLLPVAVLFVAGVGSAGGLTGVLHVAADPLNRAAVGNSLLQGGLSAAAALAIGYPAGVFLGRYRWRGRAVVEAILLVPFLLPTIVLVLAVQGLFGAGGSIASPVGWTRPLGSGLPGIVLVNVLFNVPVVVLLTAVGVESSSAHLEETVATLGGAPWRAYREVWGPASVVGGLAGALLTFLFSALAFAAPLLLCGPRCYTLEARVWALDMVLLQPTAASVLALVMVALLALPTAAYLAIVYRLRRPTPGGPAPRRTPGGVVATMLRGYTVALVGFIVVVLGSVVLRSLSPVRSGSSVGSDWAVLFSPRVTAVLGISPMGALANTLAFASAAAILALLLGVVSGLVATWRPSVARTLHFVLFLPLLLSPIVLSFSLAEFWRPLLGGEESVWALILLSQATLALPFALQTLLVALARLPAAPRESARLLGASPWRAYLDVDLPAARGGLVAAALFAFALSLGEFTATYFLATPAFTTLPVLLYRLEDARQYAAADALSTLLLLASLGVLVIVALGGRRVEL